MVKKKEVLEVGNRNGFNHVTHPSEAWTQGGQLSSEPGFDALLNDEENDDASLNEQLCDLDDAWGAIRTLAHYARQATSDEEVERLLATCERWYRKTRQRLLDEYECGFDL